MRAVLFGLAMALPVAAYQIELMPQHGGKIQTEPMSQSGAIAMPQIHYAPAENLEHIDVALIGNAQQSIDMAAYVLTDVPVIEALTGAAQRGVAVRVYLYTTEIPDHGPPLDALKTLQAAPHVQMRFKDRPPLMHLKSYQIDGRLLRTGSANLSASGLKQQNNDLVIIESQAAAAAFEMNFNSMWEGAFP